MTQGKKISALTRKWSINAGERGAVPVGKPVATPIYATATFTYDSMAEVDQVFAGEKQGYISTRYGNPTFEGLQQAVQDPRGGRSPPCLLNRNGSASCSTIRFELRPGSIVLASQDLYGPTLDLLYKVLGAYGIKTQTANFSDVDALSTKALESKPQVLVAETISNPLLKIRDISACSEVAREVGARFIVDNTFASPYLCQPLKHGADFVVHSATKYLEDTQMLWAAWLLRARMWIYSL